MQQFHALFWIKLIFHTTGAHLVRQIRLPRQQQTLLEVPLKNIYSIDPIAISIKIDCVQISTLQNKFLSSHSCAIIFQNAMGGRDARMQWEAGKAAFNTEY